MPKFPNDSKFHVLIALYWCVDFNNPTPSSVYVDKKILSYLAVLPKECVDEIIPELVDSGLVRVREYKGTKYYEITEDGVRFSKENYSVARLRDCTLARMPWFDYGIPRVEKVGRWNNRFLRYSITNHEEYNQIEGLIEKTGKKTRKKHTESNTISKLEFQISHH